jgi:hypothetical protein
MKQKLFITLLSSLMALMASQATVADMQHQKGDAESEKSVMVSLMEKVSPMPMLMSTLVKHSETLELTQQQMDIFAKWRKENMASAMTLATSILNLERQINAAALKGDTSKEVTKLLSTLMDKRLALASKMLACRDNVKNALTEQQWDNLVHLYNSTMHHS